MCTVQKKTGTQMFRSWSRNVWNFLDGLSFILFFTGYALRYYEKTLVAGRVVYAVDIIVWYLKIFQYYRISATLGPYIVMIYRMVRLLGYNWCIPN